MTSPTSQQAIKRRPVDWVALSLWAILFVAIGIFGFLIYRKSLTQLEVWILVKDLPAYHLVVDSDVTKTTQSISGLPVDTISPNISPAGAFTIRSVRNGFALSQDDIVLPANLQLTTNTVALSIPATEAMTFGGRLTSGDVIMLWEASNNSSTSTANLLLDQVLVLDVLAVTPAPTDNDNTEVFPYVIILAVPLDRQADILSFVATRSLVFTLRPD